MDGPPPDELHVVGAEFTHLKSEGVPAIVNVPSTASSLAINMIPAAGIAAGSTLAQLGRNDPSVGLIAAGLDPSPQFSFAAGVYHWTGCLISKAALASIGLIGVCFAAKGTGNINNVIPLPGASQTWRQEFFLGNQNAPSQPFEGRMYIPKEWTAFVYVAVGLVATDNFTWRIDLWSEYVFDEAGAT